MRRNIFLHFMNRDTREIFRVYDLLGPEKHAAAMRAPLNAAAMLCEDRCIAPPGFVIEDQLAFELFENQSAFFEAGLIQMPIRERSLADYADKKRDEYAPARSRYSGLFDDSRMSYLSSFGSAIISRKVQIGTSIVDGFEGGVDTRSAVWRDIKRGATPGVIDNLRHTPHELADAGKALTWSIIQPRLSRESGHWHKEIRDALQHVYFKEYCREFKLIVMTDVPYMGGIFYLPSDTNAYNFRRLKSFLDTFSSAELFLNGSADFIVKMRRTLGFCELMDAYVGMASKFPNDGDLIYHSKNALRISKFDWLSLNERQNGLISDPTDIETREIGDGCRELAQSLSGTYELPTRISRREDHPHKQVATINSMEFRLKIALFVALEEELNILIRILGLTRQSTRPIAHGTIGGICVDVLCPRAMGRVTAAVEVTRYLGIIDEKPNLIICIGLAGGFKENNISAGAVICADTVVDLANRKVSDGPDGQSVSQFRRRDFDCNRAIYTVAVSSEFDQEAWSKYCREEYDWPKGKTPSLSEGKIASVDEVLSSSDHARKMTESVDKLLGVEMEAGGVGAAAKEFQIPFAVIRVVSDMADPSKADDEWRKVGMKTLARLLKTLPFDKVLATLNE